MKIKRVVPCKSMRKLIWLNSWNSCAKFVLICSLCVLWRKNCQTPKKKTVFLGNIVGFQHLNLLKWNSTIRVFLGITEIIFWCIIENSYYMESFKLIDKFHSSHLVILLNMAYIYIQSHKKWKDISSSLHFFMTMI